MAKAKFIKLGEKASSFFDPETRIKLTPGKVVQLTGKQVYAKKIKDGLKGGHLEAATQSDFDSYEESLETSAEAKSMDVKQETDDNGEAITPQGPFTSAQLNGYKKDVLVDILTELNETADEESKLTEKEISKFNKPELIDEILEYQDEEEEDSDDEEDEE